MAKQTNGAAPTTAALSFGAARRRLQGNGYLPVSARDPWGEPVRESDTPGGVFLMAPPDYDISEHPVAVVCRGGLLKLIVRPAEDPEIAQRVRMVLDKHKVTEGPYRLGSDGVMTFPIRFAGYDNALSKDVLGVGVTLERESSYGQYGRRPALIQMDAAWPQGTLVDTPAAELPQFDDEQMSALLRELDSIPSQLRVEHRAPPRPSRLGWIGRGA